MATDKQAYTGSFRCRVRIRGRLCCALLVLCPMFALPAWALPGVATPDRPDPVAPAPTPTAAAELLREEARAVDARIEAALSRRLSLVPGLEQVHASATAGVVTLNGEVTDQPDRALAERIARAIAEVVEVRNRITLSTDLRLRLEPAWNSARARMQQLLSSLPLVAVALAIVWLFAWVGRWLSRRERLFRRVRRNPFLASLLQQAVRASLLLVGMLIALDLLGATALVGAILGTAGLIGLVLGFAFRDLAENYIASVLLSLRQPFVPNDHVVIDGNEGRVVSLNSRATILMTLEGNHLRLPNALVFKSVMLNYTRNPKRQFHFTVGIGTGEDLAEAQRIGVSTLSGMRGVLDEPEPAAAITQLADSAVTVRFFAWIDQRSTSWLKARSEAMRLVKQALDDAGIDMPEPIHRVQLSRAGGRRPPDRPAPRAHAAGGSQTDVSASDDLEQQIEAERADPQGALRDLLDPNAERE